MKLLLQNVNILDPDQGRTRPADLQITGTQITRLAPPRTLTGREGERVVQGDGLYAFPGFVDFHTHLFRHGSSFGIDADRLLSSGVVCAADMGSAGWVNYPAFHRCDLAGKQPELKAYLNLSPVGQPGRGINEPLDEAVIDPEKMAQQMQAYPGEITGIKVRISRGIVGTLGLEPLRRAVEVGEHLGLPVCVHTTDPPADPAEILSLLRPGDIYSHTYQNRGLTILRPDGHLRPEVLDAQRRGVLMEVGNGRVNFSFSVACRAMEEGLFPDIISSDATFATFHQEKAMWDLAFVASKFLSLGMALPDVIRAITATPAGVLGLSHRFGHLREGGEANLALCRMSEEETVFLDAEGGSRRGKRGIVPEMTIRSGQVVFESEE